MTQQKKKSLQSCLLFIFSASLFASLIGIFWLYKTITSEVKNNYGDSNSSMDLYNTILYSGKLYFSNGSLLKNQNDLNENLFFEILPGESVGQISYRLRMNNLIKDSELFTDYLIYKGYDKKVQSGFFRIEPGMNGIEIAEKITSPIPDKVRFIILPGWRLEEIASILPRSGLMVPPDDFLQFSQNPSPEWLPQDLKSITSLEGYLLPGEYLLDREITTIDFILTFVNAFVVNLDEELVEAFNQKGLTITQALFIASMVEREAVKVDEMPLIASVYLNRNSIGMKFDSDPTVQYAVGYNLEQATWWTNPLSLNDLQYDSPFNTYLYSGFPPHPICNPSLNAIKAVAFAENTPYYYFRAKCDGSGYHNFTDSYEEHLLNGCP